MLVVQPVETIIVAVSGGVDSIVLLDLSREYADQTNKKVVVAHFNHKLRPESDEEEKWLKNYCENKGLEFVSDVWVGPKPKKNIESQARKVRYDFFKKVYDSYPSPVLVTGHHKNDLAETILMKLTSGSRFKNLVGIKGRNELDGMLVVRPMLDFTKNQLYIYAEANHLKYFEDTTNTDTRYKRNRMRHKIVPFFLDENPRFLNQMAKFSKEVTFAADIIDKHIEVISEKVISEKEMGWEIDLVSFLTLAESERHFVLESLFQDALIESGSRVTDRQVEAIEKMLASHRPNGRIDLENDWQFIKSYGIASLTKVKASDMPPVNVLITSKVESIGLPNGKLIISSIADSEACAKGDHEFELELKKEQFPLVVRNWQHGDRIVFNQEGQRKKVSRILIDKKIPRERRSDFLVLIDNKKEILSLFLGEESYLSIGSETDKIHYRLTYFSEE